MLPALAGALLAGLLAGCGQSSAQRSPQLDRLPLVTGARIATQVRSCDPGANAYCSWELLVVAPKYRSSVDLLKSEHRLLMQSGWSGAKGDNGYEKAASSPGNKLRVTYATADGDLLAIDEGWIKRSKTMQFALSRSMFQHAAALSILLEVGAS